MNRKIKQRRNKRSLQWRQWEASKINAVRTMYLDGYGVKHICNEIGAERDDVIGLIIKMGLREQVDPSQAPHFRIGMTHD